MAQVRKLNTGEKVPEKKKGNINYNGTSSEFTDDIYNSLITNLDTGAASGIIRKGFDVGRQEGNTFYYDSEHNRAYVTDSEGKKIWDYQATIGPRKNIKVQWQGTFGRNNLTKNPNDVNRLLQEVMSGFTVPVPKAPEEVKTPAKKKISTENITIGLGKDKTVSTYDANYTSALNRLAMLDSYYNNADAFTSEYDFDESNLWRTYLDTHKGSIYTPGEGDTLGKSKFAEVLGRVANGTYNNDDEKLLNAFNIFLSTEPIKPVKDVESKTKIRIGSDSDNGNNGNNSNDSDNNGNNNDSENNGSNGNDLISMRFSDYYLPQFYDATVTKANLGPENQDWIGAKTWRDPSGNDYIEFTNKDGKRYYIYTNPNKNSYLRVPNSDDIYWDENSFWDFVEKNGWTPDPTDNWATLEWMPRTELVRTVQGGPVNVIGWENLSVGNYKIPIRKSLSENPMYYAKLQSGEWIPLTPDEYNKLKQGDTKVLHNKVPIQFYKDGGKILKMQTAPGGQIPVIDMSATYDASVYQDPSEKSISGWDKSAVIGTGVGTGSHIIGALSTHPKVKRVANIASLLGFGTAIVGNTASDYQNTGKINLGNLAMGVYGITRGITPRPKQRYFYNKNIPVDAGASRGSRMWKGVQNYAPRAGQALDIGTGLMGTTFGTIGTVNLIGSIAKDPNKTWNWNTWTMNDARNFQMGMTGLSPLVAGSSSMIQNAKMRKYLPKTSAKLGSLDEINFAGKFTTQLKLHNNALNYIKTNPIKEAYFGNPYNRAINVINWNNPLVPWRQSTFTTSPSAIGLTGGLLPWAIYNDSKKRSNEQVVLPQENMIPFTTESLQSADTIRFNGGLMFKKGGILKAKNGLSPFKQAFADARNRGDETFEWNGKQIKTNYEEETDEQWRANLQQIRASLTAQPVTQTQEETVTQVEPVVQEETTASVTSKTPSTSVDPYKMKVEPIKLQNLSLEKPVSKSSVDIAYDFAKSSPFKPKGILGDMYDLKLNQTFYPDKFKTTTNENVELSTPEVGDIKPEDVEVKGNEGKWAKSLSLTGSLILPGLELGKFTQAMSTASKNGRDERSAIDQAIKARYRSASPLTQVGYDFSEFNSGLNNSLGQLNSRIRNMGSMTSDNNSRLAAFSMYNKNITDLNNNYNNLVSKYKTSIDSQNLGLRTNWLEKEYDRVNANNTDVANGIIDKFKSRDAERQAKSGHVNTLFNTFQDWFMKDKATGSNLNELLTLRESIVKQGLISGQDVSTQLGLLDQRIAEARQNSKILPSFKKV